MNDLIKKRLSGFLLSNGAWIFILLTIICLSAFFKYVDLTPHVDYDVFFSSEDPNYKADVEISRLFPRNDDQIIISVEGSINSKGYQTRIKKLGDLLLSIKGVKDVRSIVRGPESFKDATEGPFWKRLLIAQKDRSSNLFVSVDPSIKKGQLSTIITKIESLKSILESPNFKIHLSGFPYIVELIRRHLDSDLKIFSSLAFVMFGVIIIFIFHSWRILIGMVLTCINAAALTLIISNILNIKIGILTANLTTIIFVITLSHIVFLTFNWKHINHNSNAKETTREAIKMTVPASFWAMFTTLLGFLSILSVEARPIRELGASGAIGTLFGFIMAYTVYPSFLRLTPPSHEKADQRIIRFYKNTFRFFEKNKWAIILLIFGVVILTAPNLKNINTDPSLISFFSQKSDITEGLKYVDSHGGSNPLVMIIKDPRGNALITKGNLKRLTNIQGELEKQPDAGTVLSMPLLIEQARRESFFSFLLSNKQIIRILSNKKYNSIARGFITADFKEGLFLLRMKEGSRKASRLKILDDLKQVVKKNKMTPYLMGGIYPLQGHLSKHVVDSLIFGLSRLLLVFSVIALITSLSIRTGLAMTFSICLIPLSILGVIGTFKIPLDIIAAPGSNIAISMGIDAMIHMTHTYRRLRKQQPLLPDTWHTVREKLWEPVMTSMLIVCSGFGIFFFSNFPATQRFGGSIVLGTIIAAFSALFIFPLIARKSETNGTDKAQKSDVNKNEQKRIEHLLQNISNN